MVAPSMRFEIIDELTEGLSVRGRRNVMTAANEAAALLWRDEMLAEHFKTGAASRYGYARRANSTMDKKRKLAERGLVLYGGRRPLVHSGVLKRAMGRHLPIRATPKFGVIDLIGPSYFRINTKAGRPNLAGEVTRIVEIELRRINKASEAAADKAILKNPRKRKKVIK